MNLKSKYEEVALIYTRQVQADPKLRPASKEVRLRPLATLRRTWPERFNMEIRSVPWPKSPPAIPSSDDSLPATHYFQKSLRPAAVLPNGIKPLPFCHHADARY
jgi:hypothetical protein